MEGHIRSANRDAAYVREYKQDPPLHTRAGRSRIITHHRLARALPALTWTRAAWKKIYSGYEGRAPCDIEHRNTPPS